MRQLVQAIFDSLSLGSTYALLALGLALIFSIMGLINFAHGELLTVSAYCVVGLSYLGVPGPVIVPSAVITGILAAMAMERVAFRPVRGASPATMLITSFGVSVVVQGAFLLGVSPRPKALTIPAWASDFVTVFGLRLSVIQLITMAIAGITLIALWGFLNRTHSGIGMRAAAQDFPTARLMGLRANRLISWAFALSGALAGVATLFLLTRRGAVDPHFGLVPVVKAFVAAVIGGLGSLVGAVIGGVLLGAAEVGFQTWLPTSLRPFRDVFVFSLVFLLLLVRPQGLIGRRTAVHQ